MRKLFLKTLPLTITGLFLSISTGQESSYLAQKLMVENNVRNRISDALSKVIDESQYVIDVSVELELSDAVEEEVTFVSGQKPTPPADLAPSAPELKPTADEPEAFPGKPRESMVGLPIPGFEFELADEPPALEEKPLAETRSPEIGPQPAAPEEEKKVLSRTSSYRRPSIAKVRRQEISIILQEGAAPELIENIRQLVMMASRFNRSRGDALSIMTASFKERRDEKTAEQILLKTIAEKIEAMEMKRAQEKEAQARNWQEELARYREEESKRREEDRLFFQEELSNLERSARDRAYQTERERLLRRDSLRIQSLYAEIESLREMMALPGAEEQEILPEVQQREQQIAEIDARFAEILGELDRVQEDLDQPKDELNGKPSTMMIVLLALLGALLLVLLIAVLFALFNRTKHPYPPPPWMYPPRRPVKRKKKTNDEGVTESSEAPSSNTVSVPDVEEDPSVLQSEIEDMKQAVVSMSVGQPGAATRIVKEWLADETPVSPPVVAKTTPPPAEEEEDEAGKKKKKKKK